MSLIPAPFPLGYDTETLYLPAQMLCQQYGFYLDQHALPRLQLTAQGLCLSMDKFSPLMVNFNDGCHKPRDKKHSLIRACKPTAGLTILDATAGWGRDAALLAQYGAKLILVERQPTMAALLADGLNRLVPHTLDITSIHQDTWLYLNELDPQHYPDVLYLDPMHPERQKSALVKKDMQALQQLFGPDLDFAPLLNLALQRVKQRVIVKWPQRLTPLLKPHLCIEGKTVRFDIYRVGS